MQRNMSAVLIVVFFLSFLVTGCNLNKLAVRSMGGMLQGGFVVFNAEPDLILAKTALESNLKLIETLLEADPENETLLLFASQGFSSYAFAFAEDAMEEAALVDEEVAAMHAERARQHYWRGRNFALRVLEAHYPEVVKSLEKHPDDVKIALEKVSKKEDAELLFWIGYGWGGFINLSLDNMAVVADISKVELIMKRALELDETYFNGGPHLFFGVFLASRPEALGGQPEEGKKHLDRVIEITGGRLLLPSYFLARFYAQVTFNCKVFVENLEKVIQAPPDIWPEQRLANEVAKKRARRLLENLDEYFDPETDCQGVEVSSVALAAPEHL